MIVFKTTWKILNRLKGILILYTVMLVAITLLNQTSSQQTQFEETKPSLLIINQDTDNTITQGFIDYLQEHCEIKDIDTSKQENIDDALFYRDINFILYIPQDFSQDILKNKNPQVIYQSSNDQSSAYCKMMVEKYIKTLTLYKDYYKENQINSSIKKILDHETTVQLKTSLDTTQLKSMTRYFNFLNYAFLAGCVYCISTILASLKEEKIYKRTLISSFPSGKYNGIVFLSLSLALFLMWLFYMGLCGILFKELLWTSNGIAYMINSFVFALCSLSIGFLVGHLTTNRNAIGGIVNVLAVGTSFLCGCFVPMEFMPDYVIQIAHVLPSYYFVLNNETIRMIEKFNSKTIQPLLINGAFIFAFTLFFIVLTRLVQKKKQKIG